MRIRAIANGNILEMSEDEARPLIQSGIFEVLQEEKPADEDEAEPDEAPRRGRTKRRDIRPED